LILWWTASTPLPAADWQFEIKFSPQIRRQPYTGRVYLFFSRDPQREPRLAAHGSAPDWFHPEPFLAVDIENWKPGELLTIDSSIADWTLAFPKPLAELELSGCRVQAVARFNPLERAVGNGPGNGYSAAAAVSAGKSAVGLTIDQTIEATPFPENHWCRLLAVRSTLLSEFHKRDVLLQGAVLLPRSYFDEPPRRYPVIFSVPGFGGTHRDKVPTEPVKEQNAQGVEFIRVTLDPGCPLGHHVFADSANNGPVGTALLREFLPELDRQYRTVTDAGARFLTGHSSGGWSTLWLQVTWPEEFGGVWSTAPDPVDFHDFQQIDLYRPGENMYRDRAGNRRPIARSGGQVLLWYDDFDRMERVSGDGGQLHSFEAVFSPRGDDGRPLAVWSRKTGAVDTAAALHWKKFDIRLILESRWPRIGQKLAGKLHVFMGDKDTFYLEGATRRLKESLAKLGSDAVVELVPGKDHMTLYTPELLQRIRGEMVEAYLKHQKAHTP
jgi:hypothetical protein